MVAEQVAREVAWEALGWKAGRVAGRERVAVGMAGREEAWVVAAVRGATVAGEGEELEVAGALVVAGLGEAAWATGVAEARARERVEVVMAEVKAAAVKEAEEMVGAERVAVARAEAAWEAVAKVAGAAAGMVAEARVAGAMAGEGKALVAWVRAVEARREGDSAALVAWAAVWWVVAAAGSRAVAVKAAGGAGTRAVAAKAVAARAAGEMEASMVVACAAAATEVERAAAAAGLARAEPAVWTVGEKAASAAGRVAGRTEEGEACAVVAMTAAMLEGCAAARWVACWEVR